MSTNTTESGERKRERERKEGGRAQSSGSVLDLTGQPSELKLWNEASEKWQARRAKCCISKGGSFVSLCSSCVEFRPENRLEFRTLDRPTVANEREYKICLAEMLQGFHSTPLALSSSHVTFPPFISTAIPESPSTAVLFKLSLAGVFVRPQIHRQSQVTVTHTCQGLTSSSSRLERFGIVQELALPSGVISNSLLFLEISLFCADVTVERGI